MAKLRFVHAAGAAPIQEGFTGVSFFLFPLFPRERGDSFIILKVLRSLWVEHSRICRAARCGWCGGVEPLGIPHAGPPPRGFSRRPGLVRRTGRLPG